MRGWRDTGPPRGGAAGAENRGLCRLIDGMDSRRDTADWRVAEVAARQYGIVAIAQLLAAGMSHASVRRRVESGRLHRLHRGVYAVGYPSKLREAAWMAAVLVSGTGGPAGRGAATPLSAWGAALSHRSAAELWSLLPQGEGRIDVSVAGIEGQRPRKGVHVHRSRTLSPDQVTMRAGIPVTTPERTFSDLRLSRRTAGCPSTVRSRDLRGAERQAAVLGLRLAGAASGDRTRSDLERDFLALGRRHDLPAPEVNVRVGPYLVDFLWRERRLIVETDSYRYHRGHAAFAEDHARDLALRELGHDVIRVDERQLEKEPARVARLLRSQLLRASS